MATPHRKGRGGVISHFDVESIEVMMAYKDCCWCFRDCDWYTFCEQLRAHNVKVARSSTSNYDGKKDTVGNLSFVVNEQTIVDATKIPREGERRLKGFTLNPGCYNQFLTEDHRDADWGKGIPRS